MALIVEDGTGRADSESYGSVADADTYHSLVGNTTWAAVASGDKEIALRKATQYIDAKYDRRWLGARAVYEQRLCWPRVDVVEPDGRDTPADELPRGLVEATFEAALKSLTEDLWPDITTPGDIKEYEIKVGPINERTVYSGSGSQLKYYHRVHLLLFRYLRSGSQLERA